MKISRVVLSAVCLGALLSGCGTITNGTKQKVSISTSNGQQVVARVNNTKVTIPAKDIEVSRKKGTDIKVLAEDNPCYEDTSYAIAGKGKVSGVFWINIFSGGFFGSTTDAISGGMWEYNDPNFVVPVNKKPNCNQPSKPIDQDSQVSQDSKESKEQKTDDKPQSNTKPTKSQAKK